MLVGTPTIKCWPWCMILFDFEMLLVSKIAEGGEISWLNNILTQVNATSFCGRKCCFCVTVASQVPCYLSYSVSLKVFEPWCSFIGLSVSLISVFPISFFHFFAFYVLFHAWKFDYIWFALPFEVMTLKSLPFFLSSAMGNYGKWKKECLSSYICLWLHLRLLSGKRHTCYFEREIRLKFKHLAGTCFLCLQF